MASKLKNYKIFSELKFLSKELTNFLLSCSLGNLQEQWVKSVILHKSQKRDIYSLLTSSFPAWGLCLYPVTSLIPSLQKPTEHSLLTFKKWPSTSASWLGQAGTITTFKYSGGAAHHDSTVCVQQQKIIHKLKSWKAGTGEAKPRSARSWTRVKERRDYRILRASVRISSTRVMTSFGYQTRRCICLSCGWEMQGDLCSTEVSSTHWRQRKAAIGDLCAWVIQAAAVLRDLGHAGKPSTQTSSEELLFCVVMWLHQNLSLSITCFLLSSHT